MRSSRLCGLQTVVCLMAMCVPAFSNAAGKEPDALVAAVSQAAERFTKAYLAGDAKAVGQLFTAEAEYIDSDGTIFHGRGAIEAEYVASFAQNPPGNLAIDLISVRPIAKGAVVEEGISTFTAKDGGRVSRTRYTATHVRQEDGSWLMASVRELGEPIVTPHDRLKALSWLIGRWHEDVDGSQIRTEWKWSEDGNFLLSEFSVRQSVEESWKGTHRVGWCPERKQFRSWIFDSTGGVREGWWQPAGDQAWTITFTGVDADGVRLSSLLTYETDGADAIRVTQTHRIRGGVSLPGQAHRVVRQPPAPTTDAASR